MMKALTAVASVGTPPAAQPKPKRVFTEEQREANRQRERDRKANMTPEQLEQKRQRDRKHWHKKTPEQKAEHEQARQRNDYAPHDTTTAHTAEEILNILGDAVDDVSRPRERGFAPWQPQGEALKLVGQIKEILHEYRAHLPLTVRQVLYRLMGKFGYEKSIEEMLYRVNRRARRARIIDMDSIRDDGGIQEEPQSWDDADEYLRAVQRESQNICHDRQEGQRKRLVVYCEAAGMVPQLARVANEYGVPVISSGGFDSLTEKHLFGRDRNSVEVLHIGDFDPSGIWMFIALAEDVSAFAAEYGNEIDFTRIAVTPEQIERLALETQAVNPDNKLAFPGDVTAQAEAIAPDELANIVREAIVSRLNMRTYRAVLKREKDLHAELAERLADA
jgi:rhodanese-related sulfurtransferase